MPYIGQAWAIVSPGCTVVTREYGILPPRNSVDTRKAIRPPEKPQPSNPTAQSGHMWGRTDLRGCHLGSCVGTQQLRVLPCRAPPRRGARGPAPRAAMVAEPRSLEVRAPDGSAAGTESLSLRVAEPAVASGLVHRYVVFLRQNLRRVRLQTSCAAELPRTASSC